MLWLGEQKEIPPIRSRLAEVQILRSGLNALLAKLRENEHGLTCGTQLVCKKPTKVTIFAVFLWLNQANHVYFREGMQKSQPRYQSFNFSYKFPMRLSDFRIATRLAPRPQAVAVAAS
jgi:hypothetical protein